MKQPPTLVFLHLLGGSARTWQPVIDCFEQEVSTLTVDLPGFGDEADAPGDSVADMADAVAFGIGRAGLSDYVLVGHSMGAKVAAVVARRAEDGAAELTGLQKIVVMAGSPPSPEPMEEATRRRMLAFFQSDRATNQRQAQGFVDDNVSAHLSAALNEVAIGDVLRADSHRWRDWLTGGSQEGIGPTVSARCADPPSSWLAPTTRASALRLSAALWRRTSPTADRSTCRKRNTCCRWSSPPGSRP
ncbi:MAG: alpha/beta fold hydrolase [Acetobacteraceae bacterium]|nr:alpha/beta fold hydrolase [Acetobacteraceae bacterium]